MKGSTNANPWAFVENTPILSTYFYIVLKKIYGKIICTTFSKQHAKGAMNVAKHSDVVFTVFHPKGLNDDTEFSEFYNAVFKGV